MTILVNIDFSKYRIANFNAENYFLQTKVNAKSFHLDETKKP